MVFKVSVFEFDQCFSPNSIWADEEDSVDTSMSSREGKRSKSLGQSIGTSLCSLKDGRVEVELAKVDVQILVDDVGVSGVDFNRSNGIESSAAGFSKDIFNAFIDSCNADAFALDDGQKQSVSDHGDSFVYSQRHISHDGSHLTTHHIKNELSLRVDHDDTHEVGLLLCQQLGARSGENKQAIQED
ncbi:hypothetical protein V6N11_021876 [Hibiscus sabdariffa]|uniref:Uncharacterized protein n=1 Tax=Hibiscus sabdariffa TaxID=183260 RepID=A0ABR2TIH2_9ROSI